MQNMLWSGKCLRSLFNYAVREKLIQYRTVITRAAPVHLAYVDIDEPSHRTLDGQRTPLIIFHGLFGSTQNWRSVGKALNARLKRRVVLADLRNHGDSPHFDTMTFSELASDVGQLVTEVNKETNRAVLLGHSLGGLVCTYFALTKPKQVEKLIIEDVAPRGYGGVEATTPWDYIRLLKRCNWKSDKLPDARKEVNEQLAKEIESPEVRQFLLMNLVEKNGGIGWRLNLKALDDGREHLCRFPQEKLLGRKYEGSTLVMRGAKSDYIRKDDSALFDNFFPQWRMKTIDGAGHWIHSDQPSAFIDCLVDFINEP